MKNKLLAAALILVSLLVSAGFTYRAPEASKWEYRVATLAADDQGATGDLNLAGLGGWELVAVESNGRSRTYFFKRPAR